MLTPHSRVGARSPPSRPGRAPRVHRACPHHL